MSKQSINWRFKMSARVIVLFLTFTNINTPSVKIDNSLRFPASSSIDFEAYQKCEKAAEVIKSSLIATEVMVHHACIMQQQN